MPLSLDRPATTVFEGEIDILENSVIIHNNANAMHPITEDDIANYLANTPDFSERHAELLASVHLNSPHGGPSASQERCRPRCCARKSLLEHRVMHGSANGNDNVIIADKLQR
jgi:hypothetical protein